MCKRLSVALCFIALFCLTAYASNELEMKVVSGSKRVADPGSSINVFVRLINHTNTDRAVQIKLNASSGNWKLISDCSSITVAKNTTISKIVGIQVPGKQRAGDSQFEMEGVELAKGTSFGKESIAITVNPKFEIDAYRLGENKYLFAGDTLTINHIVRNLSNTDVTVKTTIIDGVESKIKLIQIPQDSSINSKYVLHSPKSISNYTQQSIVFLASIVDRPESEKSISSTIDVFPTNNSGKFDRYNRFPVRIAGVGVVSNRMGRPTYGTMFDVHGMGTLGTKNDRSLEFHLRGPDRSGDPLFGQNSEFNLRYRTPGLDLSVGDGSFGLSDLTESSRNGTGLKLQLQKKGWSLGSYFNKPRYYPLVTEVYAAYMGYKINLDNTFQIGALSKKDTANRQTLLFSATASNKLFKYFDTEFEYAMGKSLTGISKAYRGSIMLQKGILSASVNYLHSDPNFCGYVFNSTRLFSGASIQLKRLFLSANYEINQTNFAFDTLTANLPYSKSISMALGYRFKSSSSISIGGYQVSLEDRSNHPLFNYTKTNGRISLQTRMKRVGLNLMGDWGQMENRLKTTDMGPSLAYNATANLSYDITELFSISSFGTYQGGQENVTGSDQFYYGGNLSGNIGQRFSFSLQYNSNYEWRYYTSDRSLFSLNLYGRLNDNNEFNLSADRNLMKNSLHNKEYNVRLRYTYTLNTPISKKKDIGSVTGKIINHGVSKVGGIRLNLDGRVTITDNDGNFKFPAVPIGSSVLAIDVSSLGLNVVTEQPGPIQVTIESGKVTKLEITLTKSARIEGKITVLEDEKVGQKGYIPVKDPLEKLIVEASNGVEVFRVFSDADQRFRFEDLRPGSWQVKAYPTGLPQGYQLVNALFNVQLKSGETDKVEITVQKKARQVQFQKAVKK
jgi:hypothetical protein